SHGSLQDIDVLSGSFFYVPDQFYTGTDSFTYRWVKSGSPDSNIATVRITITPVPRPPQPPPFSYPLPDFTVVNGQVILPGRLAVAGYQGQLSSSGKLVLIKRPTTRGRPGALMMGLRADATEDLITVQVGADPVGVAANSATNQIYVANRGSNNVSVVDGDTN